MEKQSWTSTRLSSSRGFVIPASLYARSDALRVVMKQLPSQELCWASVPFETESWSAFTVTRSLLPRDRAISGVVTIAHAAPSETPQQSNSPSGSATIGAFSTRSSSMRLRRCAFGFFAPLSWLLTETWAIARFRSPAEISCRARYAEASCANAPGAEKLAQ